MLVGMGLLAAAGWMLRWASGLLGLSPRVPGPVSDGRPRQAPTGSRRCRDRGLRQGGLAVERQDGILERLDIRPSSAFSLDFVRTSRRAEAVSLDEASVGERQAGATGHVRQLPRGEDRPMGFSVPRLPVHRRRGGQLIGCGVVGELLARTCGSDRLPDALKGRKAFQAEALLVSN